MMSIAENPVFSPTPNYTERIFDFIQSLLFFTPFSIERILRKQNKKIGLDFLVLDKGTGISVLCWRKPITSRVVLDLWQQVQEHGLNQLIIISRVLGEHAMEVIHRRGLKVHLVDPEELTLILHLLGYKIP